MNLIELIGILAIIVGSIFGVNFLNKFLNIFQGGNDEKIKKRVIDLTTMRVDDKLELLRKFITKD